MKRNGWVMLVVFCMLWGVNGCSKQSPTAPSAAPEQGQMAFALDAADNIASGQVSIHKGAVSAQLPVSISNHTGSVQFEGIQVGNWSIAVQLYDAAGTEIYSGEGSAIIRKNETTRVVIHVVHNTGNLEIQVIVPGGAYPNSGKIIFRSHYTGLSVMNPDGSEITHLLDGFSTSEGCNYRGGSVILYSGDHPQGHHIGIYQANIDGSNQHRLDLPPLHHPRWAWDGSLFAANTIPNEQGQIVVLNPDGSGMHAIADGCIPVWTPDNRIVYKLGNELKVMNSDGSNQTTIFTGMVDGASDCSNQYRIMFSSNGDAYAINIDGSNLMQMTNSPEGEGGGKFNADCSKLVYERGHDTGKEIWTMNPDGSNQTQITFNGDQDEACFFLF